MEQWWSPWLLEQAESQFLLASGQDQERHGGYKLELHNLRFLQLRLPYDMFLLQARPRQRQVEQDGRTVSKPGAPVTKRQAPILNIPGKLLTELFLRKQIKAAKDDPVMTDFGAGSYQNSRQAAGSSTEGSAGQTYGRGEAARREGGQADESYRGNQRGKTNPQGRL
eukprot:5493780-Amphidinium_carterae.1